MRKTHARTWAHVSRLQLAQQFMVAQIGGGAYHLHTWRFWLYRVCVSPETIVIRIWCEMSLGLPKTYHCGRIHHRRRGLSDITKYLDMFTSHSTRRPKAQPTMFFICQKNNLKRYLNLKPE